VARDCRPPNRIDASLDDVQTPSCDPMIDRLSTQAETQKLAPRNDPMLFGRKAPDLLANLPRSIF
jgi:hypothetical protein